MNFNDMQVINTCIRTLEDNNTELLAIVNSNRRVINRLKPLLRVYIINLTKPQHERYDKELASDNWTNTAYYKRNMKWHGKKRED